MTKKIPAGRFASEDAERSLLAESSNQHLTLPLYRKLLLVAASAGVDMIIAFELIYEVPMLQILGVPITFLSLYPIVTGPAAIIILNLLGRFSDKGSNHRERKVLVVVLVSFVTCLGVIMITAANLMILLNNNGESTNASLLPEERFNRNCSEYEKPVHNNLSLFKASDCLSAVVLTTEPSIVIKEEGATTREGLLATTAVLGFVGMAVMDMGTEINLGLTRACILACSSSSDHTVLLILALVLAALGGCTINGLGLVDLSQVLHLGVDQGSLLAQITIQLVICFVMIVTTVTSTVVTGLLNIRTINRNFYTPLDCNDQAEEHMHDDATAEIEEGNEQETQSDDTGVSISDEVSSTSHGSGDISNTRGDLPESVHGEALASQSPNSSKSEVSYQDDDDIGDDTSVDPTSPLLPSHHQSSDTGTNISSDKSNLSTRECWTCSKQRHNFIVTFVCGFLGFASLSPFNVFVTDFLGKVVMGGDSTAAHDSAEYRAYRHGVSLGASGLLIVYGCNLVVSVTHKKLLDFWGLKVDFCLSNLLMASSILSFLLSEHLAAFYVCSVLYGFHRAVVYTVPYIVASNYVAEQEKAGDSTTGKSMAIMASVLPLSTCVAFSVTGPLITLTHYSGAPLALAGFSACLAGLIFLLLYRP